MPISRTDDLHFASWLADLEEPGALDDRFEERRRLACGPEGLPDDALEGLVGCLRQATPAHLCIEVTYGQWTGRAGFWGGEFGTPDLIWPDDHSWLVATDPGDLAAAEVVGVWGSSRLTGLLDADPHVSSILR